MKVDEAFAFACLTITKSSLNFYEFWKVKYICKDRFASLTVTGGRLVYSFGTFTREGGCRMEGELTIQCLSYFHCSCKSYFPRGRIFRAERNFLLFKDQSAEKGRQNTKEIIVQRGKFQWKTALNEVLPTNDKKTAKTTASR